MCEEEVVVGMHLVKEKLRAKKQKVVRRECG